MNDMVFYNDDRYVAQVFQYTLSQDMSDVYQPFLLRVPRNGTILDAGCGWGRDTLYFLKHGYRVVSFEPSEALCRSANLVLERNIRNQSFESIEWESEFDGIWACDSLQATPWNSIDSVFLKLSRALKPEGVMLVSFLEWGTDWETSPFVRGCDERNVLQLIRKHAPSFMLDAIWVSNTSVNALLFRR
jgi:cyclopropane fatty-acyl-phospholipid synthase-like methyltransferase